MIGSRHLRALHCQGRADDGEAALLLHSNDHQTATFQSDLRSHSRPHKHCVCPHAPAAA